MEPSSDQSVTAELRHRTRRFPIFALMLWAVFAFAVPRLVQTLNVVDVFAFPLGFFMNAQGSLIAFVFIAIFSALRQDRLEAHEGEDG